jgi:type VI secretion system secreted protein Hcp
MMEPAMAGNMFLALTNILGESLDEHHKMEIEIHEWAWGLDNKAPYRLEESEAAKQTTVDHVVISKMFDKASVALVNYCANGRKIEEGTITCRKNDGDTKVEYLKIKLTGVKVESVKWPGRGEEIRGVPETVNLSFLEFKITYSMQSRDGHLFGPNEFDFVLPEQKNKGAK